MLIAIPVLMLGQYCHPCWDDYSYGCFVSTAIKSGSSLFKAVLYTVKRYYYGWQGTYSASVMMALVPVVWGDVYYRLTPAIMLIMVALGTFKLLDTIVRRVNGGTRLDVLGIGSGLLIIFTELLPAPLESFYWWNGAVYYTFTFGVLLLFVDRLILLQTEQNNKKISSCIAVIMAVFLAGNNYVTALLGAEICILYMAFCLTKRKDLRIFSVILTIIFLICFLINALAPGNMVRQSSLPKMSAVLTVMKSVEQAARDIVGFSSVLMWCLFAAVAPFIWSTARKSKMQFSHPVWVQIVAFLLYASMNAPHFYAASTPGPGRLRNIVFFAFLWLILFSVFYWSGYVQRHFHVPIMKKSVNVSIALLLVVVISVQGVTLLWERGTTSSEAIGEILDGSASQYDLEQDQREAEYADNERRVVEVKALSVHPKLLYLGELGNSPDHWLSVAMSRFYQKEAIYLQEELD